MNDSQEGKNDKTIPKSSINEDEENHKNEIENNIENKEDINNNKNEGINDEDQNNNYINNSKGEKNDEFNDNNEFPKEGLDNFDDYINQNINNENNIENIQDINENSENNESNENNNNHNFNAEEMEEKDDNNEQILNKNDNNNNTNNKEENSINEEEKIDENSKNENNNIRFSSLKNNEIKRSSNITNKINEPSGFIYDEEDNPNFPNEQGNESNHNLKANQKGSYNENNENDNFGFGESINNEKDNHDYENDFDFGNNQNNYQNENSNIEINQNKNKEMKNSLLNNQNYFNFNNRNYINNLTNTNFNYNKNPYASTKQNGPSQYEQSEQNNTNTNFIPQEKPIINNLNDNIYNIPPNAPQNHPDYDPQYEQYEEFPEDGDGQNLDPNKRGKDSTRTGGAQIANTIMGAGILSIPIIMRYLGFLLGILIIIFLAISTIYSVYILIRCHEITGKNGYSMFGKITMGKFGSILIKIIIIINNLGLCIAYFRIFGEVVQTIIQGYVSPDSFWATNWHNYIYILMCGVIMIFFIFIKNISALKKVAYMGIFAVLIFSISLSILLAYKSSKNILPEDLSWNFLFPNCTLKEAFKVIPTVFLAFLFQFNVFPIYLSLKHRNMKSMMKATYIGVGFSLIIFLVVGIIGFLLYGLAMEETILNSFSDDMLKYRNLSKFIKILIIIICVSFVTTCLTSFPILFLSLRENYFNSLLFCCKNICRKDDDEVKINQGKFEKKNNYKYISKKGTIAITFVLYFLVLILAIALPKLKIIFSVVGATAGTFIAFILPNIFYIRICKMSQRRYNIVFPIIFLAFGLFFLIVSITVTFI